MPEAAVHEDHGAVLRKDKVRPTVNLAGMKPEAEAARVQCPPESQLGLRVLSPIPDIIRERVCWSTISVTCALVFVPEPSIHRLNEIRQEPDLPSTFGIVDLFAGPGGLGEGFASLVEDGHAPFRIGISVEKEASAHRTLTLRAFLREYRRVTALAERVHRFPCRAGIPNRTGQPSMPKRGSMPRRGARARARHRGRGDRHRWRHRDAETEVRRHDPDRRPALSGLFPGGARRSRGEGRLCPEEDERHYLFREYIRVLDKLRPAAFVMENVKGMLSSTVESRLVFEMLMEDLSSLGTGTGHHYEMRAIRVEDGRPACRRRRSPRISSCAPRRSEFRSGATG
jgi:DNA (cytosine-5)-methyltransferase 1